MNAAVKDVLDRIKGMHASERRALVRGMVEEGVLSEDLEDVLVSEARKHEPAVEAEEFFTELDAKRQSRP